MKTATKIELGILVIAIICSVIFQGFARKSLKSVPFDKLELSGEVVTETRKVESFSKLKTGNGLHVIFKKGEPRVELTLDKAELERIRTTVINEELELEFIGDRNKSNSDIDIIVYNQTGMERLKVRSASRLIYNHPDSIIEMTAHVQGAASLQGTIYAKDFYLTGNSAGHSRIDGKAEFAEIDLNSASNAKMEDFIVNEMVLKLSSAAHAKVRVLEKIEVDANSASSASVYGEPPVRMVNANSAASVRFKEF